MVYRCQHNNKKQLHSAWVKRQNAEQRWRHMWLMLQTAGMLKIPTPAVLVYDMRLPSRSTDLDGHEPSQTRMAALGELNPTLLWTWMTYSAKNKTKKTKNKKHTHTLNVNNSLGNDLLWKQNDLKEPRYSSFPFNDGTRLKDFASLCFRRSTMDPTSLSNAQKYTVNYDVGVYFIICWCCFYFVLK